jgi:hypothetical protein
LAEYPASARQGDVDLQQFELADRYYAEGMAYSDDHELGVFGLCMDGWQASSLLLTGRWDDAAQLSHRMLRSREISPVNQLNPLRVLGVIAARRGDQGAWTPLDQLNEWADRIMEPQWVVPARTARAEARWLEGAPELAVREVEPVCELAERADRWTLGSLIDGWPGGGCGRRGSRRSRAGRDRPRRWLQAGSPRVSRKFSPWSRTGWRTGRSRSG